MRINDWRLWRRILPVVAVAALGPGAYLTPASDCTKTSVGLIPLIDLGPGLYQGKPGGLYPHGSNTRPRAHEEAGIAAARAIRPLDAAGEPSDSQGRIVLLSIGMSNTTQEFSTFKPIADADPEKNQKLVIVDGAQGGMTAARISALSSPEGQTFWTTVDHRLSASGVTPAQVQIAWVKEANAQPRAAFPADALELQGQLAEIARILKIRFPNIRTAYYSSRIYSGYASSTLNPEPYAYQSGFAVKWLIEDQINGASDLNFDPAKGDVASPWLAWGPYLWADGLKARSDGLTYACADFNPSDGTHPAPGGARGKVAGMLLDFFRTDSTARIWFLRAESQAGFPLIFPALVPRTGSVFETTRAVFAGLAVANLGSSPTSLTLTAFDQTGRLPAGPDVVNPKIWPASLAAGEQMAKMEFEIFGPGLPAENGAGWIRLDDSTGRAAGFFLIFNDVVTLLDGMDASARLMSALVVPELGPGGFTELRIVNPGPQACLARIELVGADGTARAPAILRLLAARGALIETVAGLFPGIEPDGSEYLRVHTSQGTVACALMGSAGRYLKVLGGQDLGAGATTLYSPQYVVGGDWRSDLSIINLDGEAGSVTLAFYDRAGVLQGVPRTLDIQGEGKLRIEAQDFFVAPQQAAREGYLSISSNGVRLAGSVSFGDRAQERLASALPLVAELQSEVVFSQLASDATYYTGIALINPDEAAAHVAVRVHDAAGNLIGERLIELSAGESISRVLWQIVPELENREIHSGYIRLSSDRAIASFALYGSNDALSAVPPQVIR